MRETDVYIRKCFFHDAAFYLSLPVCMLLVYSSVTASDLRISSLTSGKSSKLEVSSMERTSTVMAAGRSRTWLQSTPRKNDTDFTSSMPRADPSLTQRPLY